MDKKRIITIIQNRILSEHRKYSHCDGFAKMESEEEWAKIAAYKIYGSLKEMIQ